MTEKKRPNQIKRPDFQEAKVVTFIPYPENAEGFENLSTGDVRVIVHYHGRQVHLLIKKRLPEGEYEGEIIGFSPPAENCEDLSLHDKVIFQASSVFCVFR